MLTFYETIFSWSNPLASDSPPDRLSANVRRFFDVCDKGQGRSHLISQIHIGLSRINGLQSAKRESDCILYDLLLSFCPKGFLFPRMDLLSRFFNQIVDLTVMGKIGDGRRHPYDRLRMVELSENGICCGKAGAHVKNHRINIFADLL